MTCRSKPPNALGFSGPRRRAPSGGFTLVEMLVVIVIIGVLASLATVGVMAALDTSKRNATLALIGQLRGQLEAYRMKWGDYPPTTLADLKFTPPNSINNGIEAMTACLASRQKGGPMLESVEFTNVDADRVSKNVTDWFFGDNELREVADIYGQPLVYLHHKDYSRGPAGVRRYLFARGASEIEIQARRDRSTQAFFHPDKFQIISIGKDGQWGTDDDIGP